MIDLRSDTVTRPSDAMREAAANAAVGDDVYGEDPTVNELEATAAELLGKQAALYLPSGTMGNQVAALTHTEPGESVVAERWSHIYGWESGGLAVHAGVQVTPIEGGESGIFTPEELREAIIGPSDHQPTSGLVALENTHNYHGGIAIQPDAIAAIAAVAAAHDLPVHLDGARLFNAAVALDVPPADIAAPADTVMCSLSKGLGAPVGSILAGPEALIDTARAHRGRLGGAMRQAGVIAAPGLVGLQHWERLAEDHRRAAALAAGIDEAEPLHAPEPDTNIVIVDVGDLDVDAEGFVGRLAHEGVRAFPFGEQRIRLCTHWDLDDADIETAIDAIRAAV